MRRTISGMRSASRPSGVTSMATAMSRKAAAVGLVLVWIRASCSPSRASKSRLNSSDSAPSLAMETFRSSGMALKHEEILFSGVVQVSPRKGNMLAALDCCLTRGEVARSP